MTLGFYRVKLSKQSIYLCNKDKFLSKQTTLIKLGKCKVVALYTHWHTSVFISGLQKVCIVPSFRSLSFGRM